MKNQPIKNNKLLIAIIVILALINAGMVARYVMHSHSIEDIVAEYPYIDPSRNFIPQEHYITTLQPLREAVRDLASDYGGDKVSIYIEFLNTGANVSINPDTYISPASLIKLPIVFAVMKKIEDGEWKLSNELVLMSEDRDRGWADENDPLWGYPIGSRFTIERLLEEMLATSDNTAYFILSRNLTVGEVNHVISNLGLEKLLTEDGRVSAKEYSRFLRSLYSANFLNRENSQRILEWLDASTFEDFLAHSISNDIPFPHKFGENTEVRIYADSGIVYVPNRPFIISVMIQGSPKLSLEEDRAQAIAFMRAVSQEAYEYISK
ncbi:MAG: serine hydrolase [Candidatus Pacebacteria bacterium]|nr:serine hydrolase [Candidatus Paceibacterota bacterium]